MRQKVRHLYRKWSKVGDRDTGELQGMVIGDQELDRFCEEGSRPEHGLDFNCSSQNPPIYGGCVISENQKSILTLPPKLTTYDRISEKQSELIWK